MRAERENAWVDDGLPADRRQDHSAGQPGIRGQGSGQHPALGPETPLHQCRSVPPHGAADERVAAAGGEAGRAGGHLHVEPPPAPGALLRHSIHGRGDPYAQHPLVPRSIGLHRQSCRRCGDLRGRLAAARLGGGGSATENGAPVRGGHRRRHGRQYRRLHAA